MIVPTAVEVLKNLADHSPTFQNLDQRRAEALRTCQDFWYSCEDLAPYVYKRILEEGSSPFFKDDFHFSAFGTRLIAEHYLAVTKRALNRVSSD